MVKSVKISMGYDFGLAFGMEHLWKADWGLRNDYVNLLKNIRKRRGQKE